MSPRLCYLNGRYLPVARATVPATDRGFLYGEGLFETWRTYGGEPFAVEEHCARLARSARRLQIPFDPHEDWPGRTRELMRRNRMGARAGIVRLTITRGGGPIGLIPAPARRPTRLILLRGLDANIAPARARGVAVHLLDLERAPSARLRELKTLNYLPAVLGKTAAARHGCFESIYRLGDGTLLEGTTTNLFVVARGRLLTAPVATGVLPGVTRAFVARLARALVPVVEARITTKTLASCDEAFLTSTSIEIVPILRAGADRIGSGEPGQLTRELQQRYRALVARRLQMDVSELGD